jgi:hypothetical protein
MKATAILGALLFSGTPGCSGSDAPVTGPSIATELARSRGVVAKVDAGVLVLSNATATDVHVGVVETRYFEMALRLWCFGYDPCGTSLPAGKTLRIPFAEIPGYYRGAVSAEVFWWKSGVDPQSDQPLQVHQFRVRLRR